MVFFSFFIFIQESPLSFRKYLWPCTADWLLSDLIHVIQILSLQLRATTMPLSSFSLPVNPLIPQSPSSFRDKLEVSVPGTYDALHKITTKQHTEFPFSVHLESHQEKSTSSPLLRNQSSSSSFPGHTVLQSEALSNCISGMSELSALVIRYYGDNDHDG